MDQSKRSISIIIPLYRGSKYIPGLISQIESCAECIPDTCFEIIFSNDSPDENIESLSVSSPVFIRILNTDRNRGIHGARVRGFLNSAGSYVLFLDQDDKILPEYFRSQLERIGQADAVICNAVSGGRLKYNAVRPLYKAADRRSMIEEGCMILSPGQVLIRRDAVPREWTENIMQNNGADDWLLWLCMHSEGKSFAVNQEALFIRELHCRNASFDSLKMAASESEAVRIVDERQLLDAEERKSLKVLLPGLQEKRIRENEKFKRMFWVQNSCLHAYHKGLSPAGFLRDRNVKRAAVYGGGYLGECLLEDLRGSDIETAYVIDRNAAFLNVGAKCCTLEDELEQVDAVIVTLVTDDRDEIEALLKERVCGEIYWLEDITADLAR